MCWGIPIIKFTNWANFYTSIRKIISVWPFWACFDAGSSFIVSKSIYTVITTVNTYFSLNLTKCIFRLWANINAHHGWLICKLKSWATVLGNTISQYWIPIFIIVTLCHTRSWKFICIIHCRFCLRAYCNTGSALPVRKIVRGWWTASSASAGTIICKMSYRAL